MSTRGISGKVRQLKAAVLTTEPRRQAVEVNGPRYRMRQQGLCMSVVYEQHMYTETH